MSTFAFVFPGQGSQSVGMLDAWGDHPAVRDTLAEASQALGEDIGRLIHEGPKEQLDLTTNTQPVMLAAAIVACYRAWMAETGRAPRSWPAIRWANTARWSPPGADAGRCAAAGALPRPGDAGGRAGGRARWRPSSASMPTWCAHLRGSAPRRSASRWSAANYNDPKQTVIAGSKAAVDRPARRLAAAPSALPLPVSAPFHCALMRRPPSGWQGAARHGDLRAPRSRCQQHRRGGADRARRDPRRSIARPSGRCAGSRPCRPCARGVTHLVECGPGKVLAGWAAHRRRRLDGRPCGTIRPRWAETKGMLA